MTGESETSRPWYRHFWVWFLVVPPASTVIFWIVILTTAAEPPSLVVDDYARIGLLYERERARDARAAELGVSGRIHVARSEGRVTVALVGLADPPARLQAKLAHPTETRRDLSASLERDEGGLYRGELGSAADGRRYIEIRPPANEWRLAGELLAHRSDLSLDPPEPLASR